MPPPKAFRSIRTRMAQHAPAGSSSCCKTVARFLFSHVGLFILVTIYAVAGAYIFIELELKHEDARRDAKRRVSMDIDDSLKYIISLLWYKTNVKMEKKEYHSLVMKNIKVFHDFVVDKASGDVKYDGNMDSWDYDWTLSKSLLFTVTTMAVIGYGHISPKSKSGQIFCILYSVIGIPLLMVFLANIGDFLADSFRYVYRNKVLTCALYRSRLCCRWCRIRRRFAEATRKGRNVEKRELWKDEVGKEKYVPTEKVIVPITVNLCVISVYLMAGGVLFSWWEGWDQLTAVYFTFITLTTIGFGDLVPGNSFLGGGDNGLASAMKMLVTVLYCLFGMALLSMCINLMQEQLVTKTRWLLAELGIIEEDIDPMEKYKYKKTKRGTVVETDRDHDGNKRLSLMTVNEGESTTKHHRVPTITEELAD